MSCRSRRASSSTAPDVDDERRAKLDAFVADRLGLVDHAPAAPAPSGERKLVVFTPEESLDAVRDALFAAGAGRIGEYERCSFYSPGTGTFFGSEHASPTVGEAGREERVAELRLEVLYPAAREAPLLEALVAAHPYEEPAFDVYPLANVRLGSLTGRVGGFDGGLVEGLRALGAGPVFERRAARPGRVAVFTGLPGPVDADAVVAPAGDPDVLVPELEAWALRSLG